MGQSTIKKPKRNEKRGKILEGSAAKEGGKGERAKLLHLAGTKMSYNRYKVA